MIARVANNLPDPLRFLTDLRDEIKAVVKDVHIAGMDNTDRARQVAPSTIDELFSAEANIEISRSKEYLVMRCFSHLFRTPIKFVFVFRTLTN